MGEFPGLNPQHRMRAAMTLILLIYVFSIYIGLIQDCDMAVGLVRSGPN